MEKKKIVTQEDRSARELSRREKLFRLYRKCPIPDAEILSNLGLFISKTEFSRMLYIHEIYRKIIGVHGIIVEFGTRWGQNLVLFETFRGIYEPFNRNRKIVGFDTFEGFPAVSDEDGDADIVAEGAYGVTDHYESYLEQLLEVHGWEGALPEGGRIELVKGDAAEEVAGYLDRHPETIIAMAYFDMDLYEPTRACLEAIKGCLTRGSILAFDELNYGLFPGETMALKEAIGLRRYRLRHTRFSSNRAYLVVDG